MNTRDTATAPERPSGLSLTTKIFIGLGIGILIGLLFGESVKVLQPLANGYIRLMQMTVLPYLSIALVLGLGRLDRNQALQLAKYGLLTLLAFWLLTVIVVSILPLAFPDYRASFFFSTTLLEQPEPVSFLDLYIPANPFYSLANSIVPAVTLFSAALGIALIGVPGKEKFLAPFDAFMQAIARVTRFIVRLTPYGVIPIAAVAAGTLSPEELSRLEAYFVTFIAGALLLGLVILPLLVRALTPFSYGEVVGTARDALVTAFVTNNVFVVLPMIAEHAEELVQRRGLVSRSGTSVGDVIVPIAFNFPTAGKLLTLLFVPFAAWLAGNTLAASQYPPLMAAGVFSYFAKAQVALPFLLDLAEVPQDLFQLYIPTTLLNGKFDSMVGAMSLFAFALITATAMAGHFRLQARRIARFAWVSVLALALTVIGTRLLLDAIVDTSQTKADALRSMNLSRSPPPTKVYSEQPPPPRPAGIGLEEMQRGVRGRVLRVGYFEDHVPYSFRNARGDLVGFDIEMASQMAQDLGVALELVAVTYDNLEERLRSHQVDLVASMRYTHHWIRRLRLSVPYTDITVGLLVQDSRREEFEDLDAIRAHKRLRLGILGDRDMSQDYVEELLGGVSYETVRFNSIAEVAAPESIRVDATVVYAESGMAWSLLHPEYSAVIPRPVVIRRPLAFAVAPDSDGLAEFVNEWVQLQVARGNTARAYEYWVLGRGAENKTPRWSILRNVLGWID